MATGRDDTDFELPHTSSSTDHLLSELQLYGHRPFQDEPDPRLLPEANVIGGPVPDLFLGVVATPRETTLKTLLLSLFMVTGKFSYRPADPVRSRLARK